MVGIISEDFCRGGVFGVDVASLVFPCAAAGGPAPVCCEVGDASNEKGRGHVLCLHHGFWFAERQALELILSQNLIKPQTTDNQVQITT